MAGVALFSSDTKRELLLLIKRQGSVSIDEAREVSGLTRTTLREHLGHLEREGLICRASDRQGRGRPSLRYSLTEYGHSLFPTRDGALLREMLGFLNDAGHDDLIESFFVTYWQARLDEVRLQMSSIPNADTMARLGRLKELLQEQGFMPEIQHDGETIVVRECNCPYPEAIKKTRLPCQLEARFLEQVLGRETIRTSYIPDGTHACTYEFSAENGHRQE